MAVKRAKKAQRRKQMVAEKRRAEAIEGSLPARVRRAAEMPVQYCLVSEGLFETGMGTVILARGVTPLRLAFSSFLLDVYCLGIKDVMFDMLNDEKAAIYLEALSAATPFVATDPGEARKLLRDLAAWSQSLGFAPHRDFAAVERVFGAIDADASNTLFRFGRDGKPIYIPGPMDSDFMMRQTIAHLQKTLGNDGFEVAA